MFLSLVDFRYDKPFISKSEAFSKLGECFIRRLLKEHFKWIDYTDFDLNFIDEEYNVY
jgi:hypothetical protein